MLGSKRGKLLVGLLLIVVLALVTVPAFALEETQDIIAEVEGTTIAEVEGTTIIGASSESEAAESGEVIEEDDLDSVIDESEAVSEEGSDSLVTVESRQIDGEDVTEEDVLFAASDQSVHSSSIEYGILQAVVPEAVEPYVKIDGIEYQVSEDFDFNAATILLLKHNTRSVSYSRNEKNEIEWITAMSKTVSKYSSTARQKSSTSGVYRDVAVSEVRLSALDNSTAFTWDTTKLTPYFSKAQINEMERFIKVWAALIAVSQDNTVSSDQKLMKKVLGKLGVSLESHLGIMNVLDANVDIKAESIDGTNLTVEVNMNIQSYTLGSNDPYSALGRISFSLTGKGVNETGVGLVTYASMKTFCDSVKSVADAGIQGAYNEVWGKSLNKVAGMMVGGVIGKLLSGEYSSKFTASRGVYKLLKEPAESHCKKAVIKCPVDVEVYDSTGTLCARTVNGAIDNNNTVMIYVHGNEKNVFLEGDDYVIRLIGTDTGSMEYDIEEYVDDELIRTVKSINIPLSAGKEYYGIIPDAEYIDNSVYPLCDANGSDVKLSSDSVGDASEATVVDDGICGYAVVSDEGTMTYCAFDPGEVEGKKYPIYDGVTKWNHPWCSESLKCVRFAGGYRIKPTKLSGLFYKCKHLTEIDMSGFDTSDVSDMSNMFNYCYDLVTLDLASLDTKSVTNMRGMFYWCWDLVDLHLGNWDTSNVTDMSNMFYGCYNIKSIDTTSIDTTHVTTMLNMFYNCHALTAVDVSKWNTSNLVDARGMFEDCPSLQSLDVSGWNTSRLSEAGFSSINYVSGRSYVGGMFQGCSSLTALDVSGWDTSSLTNMCRIFSGCSSLQILDITNWDVSHVRNMDFAFSGCSNLSSLNLASWNSAQVTDMKGLFRHCTLLSSLDLGEFDTSRVRDMSGMFEGCSNLVRINLSSIDTSNVDNMSRMFCGCSSLSSIDLSCFDTSHVTKMDRLFQDCSSLTSVEVSNLDTSQVADMSGMFRNCLSLQHLDISNWNTSSVTALSGIGSTDGIPGMFAGCANLKSIDLSKWKTPKLADVHYLFENCVALTDVNLSGWDMSSVTDMDCMFKGCDSVRSINLSSWKIGELIPSFCDLSNLEDLDLSGWDTARVTKMSSLFKGCTSLVSLDVSGWDTSHVTRADSLFDGCNNLTGLDLSGWNTSQITTMNSMFKNCSHLKELDVSDWDTSHVVDMRSLFDGCRTIDHLDVTGWNTSCVADMSSLFRGCGSLSSIDVSAWDTSMVTDMSSVFSGCSSLEQVNVNNWNTSKVTTMDHLFYGCSTLKKLDLSKLATNALENMCSMLSRCESLQAVDVSGLNTSQVSDMESLFSGCAALTILDLTNWDISQVTWLSEIFEDCRSLRTIIVGDGWKISDRANDGYMFLGCNSLVGQFGTSYQESEVSDGLYARVDSPGSPGYLTSASWLSACSIEDATIAKIADQGYTGSAIKPSPKVTWEGKTLKAGTDYIITYRNNVGVKNKTTKATLIITGMGDFKGAKSTSFTIKYMEPLWSGANKMPLNATAEFSVTNGGYIRVKNGGKWAKNDSILGIAGKTVTAKKTGSTTIYLLDCNGKQIASKKVTVFKPSGSYELQSVLDKNLVLDIQGKSVKNSAKMLVYTRNGGKNQRYQLVAQSDGTYAIKCVHSGKYVDVQGGGTKKSQQVIQYSWNGGANQRWRIFVNPDNSITFTSKKSGMCFDIKGGKAKKGSLMIQWPANGGKNQQWVLVPKK